MLRVPYLHFICTLQTPNILSQVLICLLKIKVGYIIIISIHSYLHTKHFLGACICQIHWGVLKYPVTFKLTTFKLHLPRSFYFVSFLFYLIFTSEWYLNKNENHQSYDRFFSFSRSIQNILTFLLLELLFFLYPQGHCELL